MSGYDAVVLAGGAARRLGGVDKPSVRVGGRTLLDRVLGACADAGSVVVVGPERPTGTAVAWTREEPAGGGPVAALGAGMRCVRAETVVVLSADLPFLDGETVHRLLAALDGDGGLDGFVGLGGFDRSGGAGGLGGSDRSGGADGLGGSDGSYGAHGSGRSGGFDQPGGPDEPNEPNESGRSDGPDGIDEPGGLFDGALLADPGGRDQPLVAAYRTEPLRKGLARLAAEHGSLTGLPLRLLTAGLSLTRLPHPTASLDCDTWEDITAARARIRDDGNVLDEWIAAVKAELGIELDVDTAALLDLARDAAHGVARPAAPLTTFLVGYAAAQQGGGAEALAEATRKASALATRWAEEPE